LVTTLQRCATFIVLILASFHGWAAVSAQLSEQDIDELESVRLTIRATQTRSTETLDLSHLESDFHVMGTNTSSQYRFVNGREQSWVDYQITLQPKRTGTLTIPAIQVGRDTTPTLTLRVRTLSEQTHQKIKELVFFETEVSATEVYVQAQLIFTRRLLYSNGVQLYSDLPGAPEIADAVVLTLGETTAGTIQRGSNSYGIVEQRYAIFPESSGDLTLPAINVTASVRLLESGRVSRKGVRVGTEPTTIRVNPVPPDYPVGHPWLPAEEVSVHQEISRLTPLNVGDTVTHELLVHVKGNAGSIVPPVLWSVRDDQLRIYPQNPVINDDTNSSRVSGSRLQTTSIVPLQPGDVALPEQTVYWWNTKTDKLAISKAPPISLNIGGAPIVAVADEPTPDTVPPEIEEHDPTVDIDWPPVINFVWVTLSIIALIYLCIAFGRWVTRFKPGNRTTSGSSIQSIRDANSPAELLNGIAVCLTPYFGAERAAAFDQFQRQSDVHNDLIMSLQRAAYGEQTTSFKQHKQMALRILRKFKPNEASKQQPVLPALYSW